jgi:hypothetical protein
MTPSRKPRRRSSRKPATMIVATTDGRKAVGVALGPLEVKAGPEGTSAGFSVDLLLLEAIDKLIERRNRIKPS